MPVTWQSQNQTFWTIYTLEMPLNIVSFRMLDKRLTVTNVSGRYRYSACVQREPLHYLSIFFVCYCVVHVEHIRIWLWGAVIHLVLEPGGISGAPSHVARCKLPRYAIIAEAAVTQTDYKLCMGQRTTLSFHTTIPLSQYCTTTFPLLPCLLFFSGLDGLLNRIFLWTVSVSVC